MASAYYDIDAILAEEELVPCTTHFDFSHLSHLDPDLEDHPMTTSSSNDKKKHAQQHYLPEGSKIKMPLWGVQKWAHLGYCRISLPRPFGRKSRERLAADPTQVNLRKKNERFFLTGSKMVDLLEESCQKLTKALASNHAKMRGRNARQMQATIDLLRKEAAELQQTLIATYTGERLRATLDWAWSSVGDDVTAYTAKLTEMERYLFGTGAMAAFHHEEWKLFGHCRFQSSFVLASSNNKNNNSQQESSEKFEAEGDMFENHPDEEEEEDDDDDFENRPGYGNRGNASNKRRRVR